MKFLAGVSVLASLASAASVELGRRASPLDVKLEMVGNTAVKATITNNGAEDLKVFKTGTFLDDSAVEKVEVFQSASKIAFDGLRLQVSTTGLTDDAFQTIPAGEVVEATFDIAEMHDLSVGGEFDVISTGAISYAEADSTEIAGIVPFSSNTLTAAVDGVQAREARDNFLNKRTSVQSDCTGTRLTATRNALTNCRALAAAASSAAASGAAAKMTEYFKSSTTATRSTVATVFSRVASECGSTTSGVSRYYCSDVYGACSSGVLAYTLPSSSYMVNCPLYFTGLTALSRTCHAQDQTTTTLHETTHLTQIKGTSDYGVYGYNAVRALSAAQNLNHADTYALFANAIYVGC
ncbi:Deuterolysin metalloprotease family-domain-containing protein [Pseudomassariella vexata]|uniref:Neutral protease 2 n=1 Tax=Pseudomassariella vexata TaxID=1141098 RepID=A0A1Y2DLN0_9PEZI|nr:Deuterolysin metalloprotease family-domain-containing protein [Pseudomassariella vexata]ORY60064.1 Deuterolysin metalloprotease family-domain-containing protein [Pseudomassariella vexata]